jgi:hypothetical protein
MDKVKTYLILPEDDSKTYTTEKGLMRYTGEQRYYIVGMFVNFDHQEKIIVPESVFYDSELGSLLLDENKEDDDKKEILKGGVWAA